MMRLKHILGPSIAIPDDRILLPLKSPRLQIFIFIMGALVTLLNPSTTLAAAPVHHMVAVWLLGSALFAPIYSGWEIALVRVWRRFGRTIIPEMLVMLLTLTVLSPIIIGFSVWLGINLTDPREIAYLFVYFFVFLEASTYIYIRHVYVLIFPDAPDGPEAVGLPKDSADYPVFLAGTTLPLGQIEMLRARGRQTEATAGRMTETAPQRFSDLIAGLPADMGFRIHRSIWVSRTLAFRTMREDRKLFVQTSNGTRLPVARDREREFEDWLRLHRRNA